eukprot:CAMPEP_0115541780 /NCGR_PEP_ID=MMETSP0271-20121206/90652_1 /TAXON_ID=71861 /ORGANISM="Scrippsiella trochoidea, Strain CCMP3099" /LENGTH=118 /DNA_ID=CAMNT_0002974881 /DNA_START=188 /DNA_END=541 /DNA_ORIENTATION=+
MHRKALGSTSVTATYKCLRESKEPACFDATGAAVPPMVADAATPAQACSVQGPGCADSTGATSFADQCGAKNIVLNTGLAIAKAARELNSCTSSHSPAPKQTSETSPPAISSSTRASK